MARQSWGGARGAGAVLLAMLWPAFMALVPIRAQEAQPLVSPPASTQSVYLEYQELPAFLMGRQLRIIPRATPFRNEPELAGRKVGRGTILSTFYSGPPPPQSNNCINLSFLWDYTGGRLYLDLRHDGDLANAPVFRTSEPPPVKLRSGDYFYQPFTNINLTFGPGSDSHPRLVDIHLYGYDGQNVLGGNLAWRCFWQGRIILQGREWQIGLMEDPNHLGTSQDGYLLLRPWSERQEPFSPVDGSLTGFECPTHLFFQGRAYGLTFDYLNGPVSRYKLELNEVPAETGELVVRGKFIDRLILRQNQSTSPFTVVLDSPGPATRIPVGTYDIYGIYLKRDGARAFRSYRGGDPTRPSISASNTTILRAGGPLTNWVAIRTRYRALSLEYDLRGADGSYTLAGTDRTKPPRFSVYRAGQRIGSGTFVYYG